MRSRDLHPLCCVSVDFRAAGDRSPASDRSDAAGQAGPDVRAAGVLYKWTNFGKGWRPRWLSLRNGVLTYSKIRRADPSFPVPDDARLIGAAAGRLARIGGSPQKPIGFVYLKISSFRESKSDDRRFYIFSPTKTLRLRTDSREDCVAWIKTLVSAKLNLNEQLDFIQKDVSFSTDRLQDRLRVEGLSGTLITNCEQIMQSEFAESHEQLKLHCEERLRLFNRFQQQSEEVYVEDESRDKHDGLLPSMKHEFSISGHEYNTTASSDEVEKQEFDDISDEDEPYFFDSKESFSESTVSPDSPLRITDCADDICRSVNHSVKLEMKNDEPEANCHACPHVERRKELPEPIEKEKGVSLWSIIKDNVGKDLTRVCLPVYFNEPLSSLQKCFEDLEYSYLLDQAYEYGKMGNSLMRILNVAAFAVSGYASSDGRPCKPFNPLLGETYEADYSEKGIRFFSEKVSHHPMLIACHCEGKGWKFWGDSNLKSKFWGRSIQLDPVGVLTLEFDDGEIFRWSKVTTNIYNLILGKVYCDHHGLMNIRSNQQYSCKLKFKEQSFFDSNPHQVQGFVEDVMGTKVANIVGKWDDAMYYIMGDDLSQMKGGITTENATLLWKRSMPPANPTRYNLSSFAITLNELTPDLKEKLPPTDSRLRPDQRHLENGEYGKANAEKLRLEKRQRMSSKLQEDGWKPRWFEKDTETGTFRYIGGYWEAREQKKWDECLHIFGELSDDLNVTPCE